MKAKNLNKQINAMGYREQERALLFPVLYSEKPLTKNFKGRAREFATALKRGKYEC